MEEKKVIKRKRGRPSVKEELETNEVLEIAIKVFAEKGYDGAQLKEIASRAKIANSLINYRFGNKQELWKQSIRHLGRQLKEKLDYISGYFKDLEGVSLLKAYSRQFIYFSAEHPEFFKIIFHEMCSPSQRSKWLIEKLLKPTDSLNQVIQETMNNSKNAKYPIPNFSMILLGAANTFFIHEFHMKEEHGINTFDQSEIEKHADVVVELLFKDF